MGRERERERREERGEDQKSPADEVLVGSGRCNRRCLHSQQNAPVGKQDAKWKVWPTRNPPASPTAPFLYSSLSYSPPFYLFIAFRLSFRPLS